MDPYRPEQDDISYERTPIEWTMRRGRFTSLLCIFGHNWTIRGRKTVDEYYACCGKGSRVVGRFWECDLCGAERTWRWYTKLPTCSPPTIAVVEPPLPLRVRATLILAGFIAAVARFFRRG